MQKLCQTTLQLNEELPQPLYTQWCQLSQCTYTISEI